eukprot:1160444-Pelagomonas_calceolata.AAC.12
MRINLSIALLVGLAFVAVNGHKTRDEADAELNRILHQAEQKGAVVGCSRSRILIDAGVLAAAPSLAQRSFLSTV